MKRFIEIYRKQRRYKQLSHQCKQQYAFVGIGNHSLNNLYPVLDYLKVPLKYIVTASKNTLGRLTNLPEKCTAVNDLDRVLADETIKGIFISVNPESHYSLCMSVLKSKKHVFIEKPPCKNRKELDQLIIQGKEAQREVVVGLQRRYAPACKILKKKLHNVLHYNYKYCTGKYPEGKDVLTELFIHPVDLVIYLFGKAKLISLLHTGDTLLLQLSHAGGVIGNVELSTGYSWQTAEEEMTIVQKNGIYELNNLSELLYKKKPHTLGNIPLEKVFRYNPVTEILFNQNTFQPVMQHNNLYVNGFYSELETFVSMCEETDTNKNYSGLEALRPTYELLDEIRRERNANY